MEISSAMARGISRFAWVMAAAGTVLGQLHALARAQAHPDDFAESPLARAWGEPATRVLRPLLDWSDPWTVYVTYGKLWFPVCLALTAAAYLVYRRRTPAGAERWLFKVALAAYATMTLSVFGDYFTPWMDQMFIVGIAAMLVIGFGGIALGTVMLRNGFRPRVTPILLMVFIPFMFAITTVTSLGSALLPLMWGWAIAARAVAETRTPDEGLAAISAHAAERNCDV
ncbi:MAG TPA: hypothetical protein VLJ88_08150 [Propionibacteriaceae bacterium]|nr:hypothetical protein [Propionibacteriaceae bacterium]